LNVPENTENIVKRQLFNGGRRDGKASKLLIGVVLYTRLQTKTEQFLKPTERLVKQD
jgi:hypothetical protein